jgi:hypothetical protein
VNAQTSRQPPEVAHGKPIDEGQPPEVPYGKPFDEGQPPDVPKDNPSRFATIDLPLTISLSVGPPRAKRPARDLG